MPVTAATIRVPADEPTIQAGIDAAAPGDTVLVAPGTYQGEGNRDLDFGGKDLVLRSEAGAEGTTIDCEIMGRAVWFHSGETASAVVDGFRIQYGASPGIPSDYSGAGIRMDESSPTILNCVFYVNGAENNGGGIHCVSSSPIIRDCTFEYNLAIEGAGVACWSSLPTISGCLFLGNEAANGAGLFATSSSSVTVEQCLFLGNRERGPAPLTRGAAALIWGASSGEFSSCTFAQNGADHGGAVACDFIATAVFRQCTFYHNFAHEGSALYVMGATVTMENTVVAFGQAATAAIEGPGCATLTCSDVYGNSGGDWIGCLEDQLGANGNISADPLFCDAENGDWALEAASPCAPDGSPAGCGLIGAWPVGCGATAVEETTWGAVKASFK